MLLIRNAFIFLILQNLRSSVPSFYEKMPFLQQLVLKKKKDAHALNLHTMRIWETLVSTYRDKCGVSQSRVAVGLLLVRTKLRSS